ncbi:FMN-linked oxidoreductase [Wilcoxina mikolae CBS 423.85]|nr:FMN-linked oxidoreductase [Wilcoxina mikolae CBS 423.85]
MPPVPRITLHPPLLNSATPWATTAEELGALYKSPYTGAVTTRTCLLHGFAHNPRFHQHTLFSTSSLNTYGYSPYPLSFYLSTISTLITPPQKKPFIISITGTPSEVAECISTITTFATQNNIQLYAEINLSCPNIRGKPPPAYSAEALTEYLTLLPGHPEIKIGIKTPPYTYQAQYEALISVLTVFPTTLAFVTAVNTLGSCLHLSSPPCLEVGRSVWQPTLSSEAGTGVGGLGGEAVHWIALGNVDTIRRGLDKAGLEDVVVIGVGGVGEREGWLRMLSVGAGAVGVGTALGREGGKVFRRILEGGDEKACEGEGRGEPDGVYVET